MTKSAPKTSAGVTPPQFATSDRKPVKLTEVVHPDGRISQYPPPDVWDDWVEWDGKAWPQRVAHRYTLVPTLCFNCESGCGLLAYVDKDTYEVRKFEGNPVHPGSRGRNCAKGPATHNQVYDPERILYPLKRVGKRGEGKWERISWEQALAEIAEKMRESKLRRPNGVVYHVGRPGEDGYTNRVIQSWGMDGHNSHTNICSSSSRAGYNFWIGQDRPSPDYANSRTILLVSSHLETGHYFNPHAQRIMEAKTDGAKIITLDPRLSNTASMSDAWLPTYPGSENIVLLAIANHLIQNDLYNKDFVRKWTNWQEFLQFIKSSSSNEWDSVRSLISDNPTFDDFDKVLKTLYDEYTFERAAKESEVSIDRIGLAAKYVANCEGKLATHVWRSASVGNLGGWQVSRCLLFLNVLTGSVGNKGGTSMTGWNKFVPKPFKGAPAPETWNELHYPIEYPLAHYEMSILLPHMLEEGRGDIDVYFTRVYNPLWVNPDGFMWLKALKDESKIKCYVALTPTWNETAWFADYVLPMGLGPERHDLLSQETHAGQWIGFRQPVRRVAMERAGIKVDFTYQANPGEVWEENEFWIQMSVHMDPDGSLGIRQHFESPYRKGEIITVEEYYRWIFENSVPGLPEAASKENLTPMAYMRKYGAFEVKKENYNPFARKLGKAAEYQVDEFSRASKDGQVVGLAVDGVVMPGFDTPSKKLEFFSDTLANWGWSEKENVIPWSVKSHVHPDNINREKGEMILLPNFRLPTLIHTRSANAKWLYEISHKNPIWMNPEDAKRIGLETGNLAKVETEIGYFVDSVWVTEGIKPGIIAISHHLGRFRFKEDEGVNRGASNLVELNEQGDGKFLLRVIHGAQAWQSSDPDTSRIWWSEVGVSQNLTHAVHPDPVSGVHCWLQIAKSVTRAREGEKAGDVFVDTNKSMEKYREWLAMTRPANRFSPDGNRRPYWLARPLKPAKEAYKLPK
jgi:anaerobic selenocysteine-containing dehydrogenase